MYKLLLFLHKSDEKEVENHFKELTVKYLSELIGKEIKTAKVESSLLLDKKFDLFCEVTVESKEKWDQMMNSAEGRKLNKDLMDFHQNITAIFVNYKE